MTEQLKCMNCGESLPAKRWKFCSKSCATKYSYLNCKKHKATCKHCGDEYYAKHLLRMDYCSRKCSFAAMKAGTHGLNRFNEERHGGCEVLALRRIQKNWSASTWLPIRAICRVCFRSFRTNNADAMYCSDECSRLMVQVYSYRKSTMARQQCRECGSVWWQRHPAKVHRVHYCSNRCSNKATKRTHHHRRRTRIRATNREHFTLREIAIRDGWLCGICGKSVWKNRKYPHPLSASLDHILPLALGGTHTRRNVQLAHFQCNSLKGHIGVGDQLLLIG